MHVERGRFSVQSGPPLPAWGRWFPNGDGDVEVFFGLCEGIWPLRSQDWMAEADAKPEVGGSNPLGTPILAASEPPRAASWIDAIRP
jgi:hypothetical protein